MTTRVWTMETVRGRCTEVGNCLIWKQGINSAGYPQTSINGKPGTSVRAFIFTELLGRQVKSGRRITTTCGNKRCCSEHCLTSLPVGKIIQRAYEKRRDEPGTLQRLQERCPFSKLNREQARELRESSEPIKLAAVRYGISQTSARAIRNGKAWADVKIINSVFAYAGTA